MIINRERAVAPWLRRPPPRLPWRRVPFFPTGRPRPVGRARILVHPAACDAMAAARILCRTCSALTGCRTRCSRAWGGVACGGRWRGWAPPRRRRGTQTAMAMTGRRSAARSDVRAVVLMNMGANRNLARALQGRRARPVAARRRGWCTIRRQPPVLRPRLPPAVSPGQRPRREERGAVQRPPVRGGGGPE